MAPHARALYAHCAHIAAARTALAIANTLPDLAEDWGLVVMRAYILVAWFARFTTAVLIVPWDQPLDVPPGTRGGGGRRCQRPAARLGGPVGCIAVAGARAGRRLGRVSVPRSCVGASSGVRSLRAGSRVPPGAHTHARRLVNGRPWALVQSDDGGDSGTGRTLFVATTQGPPGNFSPVLDATLAGAWQPRNLMLICQPLHVHYPSRVAKVGRPTGCARRAAAFEATEHNS